MKKFIVLLVASVAMIQSTHAATSALTESLLEYEAIISAIGSDPAFENIIASTEFIIDIKRLTRRLDVLGEVRYGIVTRNLSDANNQCPGLRNHSIKYIATLNVAQNPGIGPNIVTVLSIVQVTDDHQHHHSHHGNDDDHHED